MSVVHLKIGDGRDELHERADASIGEMLPKPDKVVVVDDSGHKLGFAGAIAEGWRQVVETGCDYCVHLEMDFTFHRPVPVGRMIEVLEAHPYLAQLVLKRQGVNAEEQAAGGIVEMWPDEYQQRTFKGNVWAEHKLFWSTNPSVYPVAWCEHGWPQTEHSEEAWTGRLVGDPGVRFAFWGAASDPPFVEHIGDVRAGRGY